MPNYVPPVFDPDVAKQLQKPAQRLAVQKKLRRRIARLTRRQVVLKVWLRDKGHCVRCGKRCKPVKESYPTDPDRGEVNDIVPVSLGGDRLDVANQELLCFACHHGGPSGAHAPTAARMRARKG
jgi:5-methylcytosine-specific restriction endonuclease McrA